MFSGFKATLDECGLWGCGDEDYAEEIIDQSIIEGNKQDLISFSILPNSEVKGLMSYRGVVQGAYFFEANILINILDSNKNVLKKSNAIATTDWMTAGPVSFEGNIDFSNLPKGPAYIEIHNDNASGLPKNDKSILIPIIIVDNPPIKPIQNTTVKSRATVISEIKAKDHGFLSECKVNTKMYFLASGSMFDGSDNIYDSTGKLIAECGGGWGIRPDPYPQICADLYESKQCTAIDEIR